MYYIYGQSGPSLLIESTDSMINLIILHIGIFLSICIYTYYGLVYILMEVN